MLLLQLLGFPMVSAATVSVMHMLESDVMLQLLCELFMNVLQHLHCFSHVSRLQKVSCITGPQLQAAYASCCLC